MSQRNEGNGGEEIKVGPHGCHGLCGWRPKNNVELMSTADNPNPTIHTPVDLSQYRKEKRQDDDRDLIDELEIYELLRNINDPEHPLTLEQLKVVEPGLIKVSDEESTCDVLFTPTIPHCSMATLIGLCLRVKLLRSLPARFKVTININPGTHASELAVNKQLNDKERVQAALENERLLGVVQQCLTEKQEQENN